MRGTIIDSERWIRPLMEGLRTNALGALGAASFVSFSTLLPAEISPNRVAAQFVSGIGFLGAGPTTTSVDQARAHLAAEPPFCASRRSRPRTAEPWGRAGCGRGGFA